MGCLWLLGDTFVTALLSSEFLFEAGCFLLLLVNTLLPACPQHCHADSTGILLIVANCHMHLSNSRRTKHARLHPSSFHTIHKRGVSEASPIGILGQPSQGKCSSAFSCIAYISHTPLEGFGELVKCKITCARI